MRCGLRMCFFLIYSFLCSAQDTGSRVKVFREVKSFWLLLNLKAQFRQKMTFPSFTHPRVITSSGATRGWGNYDRIFIFGWTITQLLQNWQGYNFFTYIKTHKLLQMTLGHVSKRIWHNAKKKTTISYVTTYMSIQHLCAAQVFVCQLL